MNKRRCKSSFFIIKNLVNIRIYDILLLVKVVIYAMLDIYIKNDDGITTYKDIEYTKKGNKLLFNTKDDSYELIIDETIKMTKDNKDSKISILFDKDKKTSGLYEIKDINTSFNLNIVTNNLEINEKLVIIDYVLYIEDEKTGNFNIKITIKE